MTPFLFVLSSDKAYSGSQSAKFSSTSGGQRVLWLSHEFSDVIKGEVSVWFYDTAPGNQTLYCFLTLYNSTITYPESGSYFNLGVMDWDGNNYFFSGPDKVGDGRTSVQRTLGWHEFKINIDSTDVQMFIDDILVHSATGDFGFDSVQLCMFGPSWRPNATYYFDDFSLDTVYEGHVALDIKPNACPNPLNVKSKGVLPVAIVGTEDFDVTDIDLASIRLEGVAPIRSSIEDVSTPLLEKQNECDCISEGADGIDDLTLKFDTQEIVSTLGEVVDGDKLVLTLTGELSDGTAIEGKDCIIILSKGKV